jgi:hypothetical protein
LLVSDLLADSQRRRCITLPGTWVSLSRHGKKLTRDEATLELAAPVIGNACELILFEIVEFHTAETLDKIGTFATRICRHSDSASGWRLRHSSAMALDISKVPSCRPSTDSVPDWEVERRR